MALTRDDVAVVAEELDVEPAVLRAVTDVESGGEGFLPDGRPKILFEGHIFWKQLKQRGVDPTPYSIQHSTIVYPRWTRKHYLGGMREYERLATARQIHEEAALCSASWGIFQLMGFNYAAAGFADVHEFVAAHERSERDQLLAAARWMESRGLAGSMQRKDWTAFARVYNGPGYSQNKYGKKLAAAYQRRVADGWNELPV